MHLNKAIAKLKANTPPRSSKSPSKGQRVEDSFTEPSINPDNFPLEEVIGEELFFKPTLEILNPHKFKAIIELASSLSIVDSPEQDLEGTQKIRQLAHEWDRKTMSASKKKGAPSLLVRGVNIDPADISRRTLLDQAAAAIDTQRTQEIEEKIDEVADAVPGLDLMEQAGEEAMNQDLTVLEMDLEDESQPFSPLSNINIRNLTQLDLDDSRLKTTELLQDIEDQPTKITNLLEKILMKVENNEKKIDKVTTTVSEVMTSVNGMKTSVKSLSGSIAGLQEGSRDFKAATLSFQQYNANFVAMATQLETALRSLNVVPSTTARSIVPAISTPSTTQENVAGTSDPKRKEMVTAASLHYDKNLAKMNFKNFTKDLFITMILRGVVKKYMNIHLRTFKKGDQLQIIPFLTVSWNV
jgi:uncharacterized protein YoxC